LAGSGKKELLVRSPCPCVEGDIKINCNDYSTQSLVMIPDTWKALKGDLGQGHAAAVWSCLEKRIKELTALATGLANLEPIRQKSDGEITTLLTDAPEAKDHVSIIKYLPQIKEEIEKREKSPDYSLATVFSNLKTIKGNGNCGDNEKAVLQSLPEASPQFTAETFGQIKGAFKDRLIAIATRPTYGIKETGDLSGIPLFGSGDTNPLWLRVIGRGSHILGQAKGLPPCPTCYAVYEKSSKKIALDSELTKKPLSQKAEEALMSAEPLAPEDVEKMLQYFSDKHISTDPRVNYLQIS
jgi:hypothetical protein